MAFFNVMISGFGRIAQHIGNIRTGFESQHSRKFCTMAFREQTSKRNSCSNDDGFQTLRNLHDKCNHEFIYQYSILSINRVQEVFINFFFQKYVSRQNKHSPKGAAQQNGQHSCFSPSGPGFDSGLGVSTLDDVATSFFNSSHCVDCQWAVVKGLIS